MRCDYACHSPEHLLSRRSFLAGSLGALTFGGLTHPAAGRELARAQRRVLVVWLAGDASSRASRATTP